MATISQKQIEHLCSEISSILSKLQINYLIYGSMAFYIYSGRKMTTINDIDIIVSETRFGEIVNHIRSHNPELCPIQTEFSIHINHNQYLGSNEKLFDISIDSYEHYFEDYGIELARGEIHTLGGVQIKLIHKADLINLYDIFGSNSRVIKSKEYLRKVKALR